MSKYIKQVIENHKALTHGHVLCACLLDFATDELHRAHVARIIEDGLVYRSAVNARVISELMKLGNTAIAEGHINTATIHVSTMHRIINDAYESIGRNKK